MASNKPTVLLSPQKESASKSNGRFQQHSKRNGTNNHHTDHHKDHLDISNHFTRRFTSISSSFLNIVKKLTIPAAVFSTAFLATGFNHAHAETKKTLWGSLWERGNIENNPYTNSGTFEGASFGNNYTKAIELWNEIGEKVKVVLDWINNINENVSALSVNLLAWCYETISSIVLQVPAFLFTSDIFKENMMNLSFVSMGLVTVAFTYNSVKQMFDLKSEGGRSSKIKYDKFSDLVKRLGVVVAAMGFAPFVLEKVFTSVNMLSKLIAKLGATGMSIGEIVPASTSSGFDVLALILFDILLIGTLIPVALQNGRRWFDLFVLSALTPVALSAWIFSDTRKYFTLWLRSIQTLCTVQLVYASFITFIGLLIFLTRSATGGMEMVFRLLIVAGGLYRMANPPAFVQRMLDSNQGNIFDVLKGFKTMFSLKSLNLAKPWSLAKRIGKIK
ncbi:hypothetical protein PQ478_08605 [Alkalihalophilus pseudofirmus]|uniref:hypothetical protein n=1 Tax=Alkalihalophilus pseudofirmus TaxID=79885 RepID=UPI00259BBD64|nr:hypothetical protein [Alkalihalophilus pseudofirmus]WEG18529.1 hypothetical protein PQ478_08605 [Alkalihalophilus pseudofirmus]